MIPREIDELMWKIAEGNDPSAIEEFGNRYPNLREEMLKRMRTIKALKAGNRVPRTTTVPTFQNTEVRPANWRWIGASFAVAILAVSAFGVWRAMPHSPPPVVAPVNTQLAQLPDDGVKFDPTPKQPYAIPNNNSPQTSPGTQVPNGSTLPKASPLKSMTLESAPLHSAIQLIAAEGNLQVTIAPGMPNPTVKVDFRDMAPMDMLKELGQTYAFTTVLDGEHAIMIIPKKDEDEGQIGENR